MPVTTAKPKIMLELLPQKEKQHPLRIPSPSPSPNEQISKSIQKDQDELPAWVQQLGIDRKDKILNLTKVNITQKTNAKKTARYPPVLASVALLRIMPVLRGPPPLAMRVVRMGVTISKEVDPQQPVTPRGSRRLESEFFFAT
ncbi:MAG: hypothetical protein EZS28_001163 [Streblomastix strix]|uniref:Uncharacterized protein n=1 Tax=Streblomastix strix TaxID=222440 RepID=A0A5J4X7W7_9EUKA|nr:MAG: hypothetical protein EZS28_001163 [Streblomastix strix]